jgi:hypothetical protein
MQCRLSGSHFNKRYSRFQSGADGQLSPAPTFGLKVCNGAGCTSAIQRKVSSMTGSYPAAQFDSSQKPYVAFGIMPKAVLAALI